MPVTDHPLHTGVLAVSPRLTRAEHERLRAMSVHPAGRAHRPGDVVPWEPTADGRALRVVDVLARDEPIAEWAAYLLDHLAEGQERPLCPVERRLAAINILSRIPAPPAHLADEFVEAKIHISAGVR